MTPPDVSGHPVFDVPLAARMGAVKPSATVGMTRIANELRRAGRDIIGLSVGEPDFDTPEHIRDAAKAAIDAGQTRYTDVDGTPELKRAIADKFARENGLTYGTDQITVGTGGKQVLYNALMFSMVAGGTSPRKARSMSSRSWASMIRRKPLSSSRRVQIAASRSRRNASMLSAGSKSPGKRRSRSASSRRSVRGECQPPCAALAVAVAAVERSNAARRAWAARPICSRAAARAAQMARRLAGAVSTPPTVGVVRSCMVMVRILGGQGGRAPVGAARLLRCGSSPAA